MVKFSDVYMRRGGGDVKQVPNSTQSPKKKGLRATRLLPSQVLWRLLGLSLVVISGVLGLFKLGNLDTYLPKDGTTAKILSQGRYNLTSYDPKNDSKIMSQRGTTSILRDYSTDGAVSPLSPEESNALANDSSTTSTTVGTNIVSLSQFQNGSDSSSTGIGLHHLTIKMQKTLGSLPTPPWPQLDNRTLRAITEGYILGVEKGSDNRNNNTIVTAYYDFESKHSTNDYLSWINRILQTSDPMIIFVEPESEWFDLVKERRSHAPTIIAAQHFDDLVMSSSFTESFWQYQRSIDLEARVHRGTGVYKIWNEKMIFLHAAIQLNPFDTPGFAWMDAGYFRRDRDAPQPLTPIVKINLTESGISWDKVFFLHVRNDDLDAEGRVNIAGNGWFGSTYSFLKLYPRYYATFWDWIINGKFIGSDQFVMTETCRRYRSNCHPYYPGRYRDWFGLSAAVAGKRGDISEISPHFLFLDEPPKNVTAVPTGRKVSYCNNTVITIGDDSATEC